MQQESVLKQALAGNNTPKAILVETLDIVGLGNRIPSIVVGFVMALFTNRVFLLKSSIIKHVDIPVSCKWEEFVALYHGTSRCDIKTHTAAYDWSQLLNASLAWCAGAPNVNLITYDSIDYDMPFLEINPTLERHFKRLVPDGEVFHHVITHLFGKPASIVQQSMAPYAAKASECLVGMQLRNRKYAAVRSEQFASIAKAIVQNTPGGIFVASDSRDIFDLVKSNLPPDRDVWWNNQTIETIGTSVTVAGNPGTELSAFVDMMLLAQCKSIVVTPSSSLGAVAAGIGGVRAFFATFGNHETPFLNPWFWGSTTSEPCCFKLGKSFNMGTTMLDQFKSKLSSFVYHSQCHH